MTDKAPPFPQESQDSAVPDETPDRAEWLRRQLALNEETREIPASRSRSPSSPNSPLHLSNDDPTPDREEWLRQKLQLSAQPESSADHQEPKTAVLSSSLPSSSDPPPNSVPSPVTPSSLPPIKERFEETPTRAELLQYTEDIMNQAGRDTAIRLRATPSPGEPQSSRPETPDFPSEYYQAPTLLDQSPSLDLLRALDEGESESASVHEPPPIPSLSEPWPPPPHPAPLADSSELDLPPNSTPSPDHDNASKLPSLIPETRTFEAIASELSPHHPGKSSPSPKPDLADEDDQTVDVEGALPDSIRLRDPCDFADRKAPSDAEANPETTPILSAAKVTKTLPGGIKPGKKPGPGDHVRYFGDYELLSELARGGMGVVYRARQRTLGRLVALKMILAGTLATEHAVRRFLIEAEAAARLDHPNIVPIYEIGEHEGLHYFSMKFVEGVSLAALTKRLIKNPRQTAQIIAKVARALAHAHQRGILHRDLKPSNILIDTKGEPHVTDFGLAKIVTEDRNPDSLTVDGAVMGTPSYMAPEQAEGKSASLTTAADIWGLGAILYDCLTGQPPFKGDTALATVAMVRSLEPRAPEALNPEVPHDLATICLKCLQKPIDKRYASAAALAQDLENWLEGKPISARPIGPLERINMWARRQPVLAGLVLAVVLSVILGIFGIFHQWLQAENARKAESEARKVAESRAVELSEQALRVRLQLHRAELVRGRMLVQAGDPDRGERVLWSAALGHPFAIQRHQSTTSPLAAGPMTPAEWALWDLYQRHPREGSFPQINGVALGSDDLVQYLATVSTNQISLLDRRTSQVLFKGQTQSTLLTSPVVSPDGRHIAAADYVSGETFVWEVPPETAPAPANPLPPSFTLPPPGLPPEGQTPPPIFHAQKTNPNLIFVDSQRILSWNRAAVELRRIPQNTLLASGRALPLEYKGEQPPDMAVTLLPPRRITPPNQVATVAIGTELRPLLISSGAKQDFLEWGNPLPLDPPDSRPGRLPVLTAAAARDLMMAVRTPQGALLSTVTDGSTISHIHRLSRDEVPRLTQLSLAPDGSQLIGLDERLMYTWSFPDLRLLRTATVLGGGNPLGLFALPGGSQAIIAEFDQTVALYGTQSPPQTLLNTQPIPLATAWMDIGSSGPLVMIPTGRGREPITVRYNNQPTQWPRVSPEEPGVDMRIHLTKDGSAIVIFTSLSLGPAVEIYPLHRDSEGRYPPQPGQLLRLTLPRNELAMALCASADGNRIAAVTNQSLVIISPPADLTQSHTQKVFPLSSPPSDVALTDCGTTTAIASAGRITLLNTDGQTSWSISLSGRLRGINLAFSNDGSQLAVPVGEDLFLIDVLSARVRRSLVSSTGGRFTAASFSPLGGLLATVNFEGRLALWDAQTGEELLSRNLESGSLYQVRFTPDGRQLRWWGEGRAATFDLHFGENRLALNLADRLPSVLPTIVSQAGTTKTNQLLETLRPLAPDMISRLLTQLPSPQTSRE